MTKAVAGLLVALFLLGLGASFDRMPSVVCSGVIHVPQDYPTIQAAVDAAAAGDTIVVSEGFYAEGQINIGKSLILQANGTVVVDGLHIGHVFNILADYVTIRGFIIQNSGDAPGQSGIAMEYYGNSIIERNIATNTRTAIKGIATSSNIIADNVILHNLCGIYFWASEDNLIVGNKIVNSQEDGIALTFMCSNNTIVDNQIVNNDYGIAQWYLSYGSTISGNTIQGNYYGILMYDSWDNLISHNSFINNTNQVDLIGSGYKWDEGYPSGGNYWSDYAGADQYSGSYQNETGSDGIGDTPYFYYGWVLDNYPLTKPYYGPYDVGMTGLSMSKTVIPEGHSPNITLKIINYGLSPQTVNLTIQADSSTIYTQTATLPARNSSDVAFIWDTTGYARGNYSLTITAVVTLDNDTSDNLFIFNVRISILGNINGDDQVDIEDIYTAATAYGSYPNHPKWNPNIDLNDDNSIDIMDIFLIAANFGKTS